MRFGYKVGRLHQNTRFNTPLIPKKQTMRLSFLDNRGIAGWMRLWASPNTERRKLRGRHWTQHKSSHGQWRQCFYCGSACSYLGTDVCGETQGGGPNASRCYLLPGGTLWWSQGAWKTHTAEGSQKCPHAFAVEFPIWSASVSARCLDIWCFMHKSFTSERLDRCWGC